MREETYAGTAPGVKPVAPSDIEKRAGYERGVHCEPCWMRRKRVTPAAGRWGSMPYCNPCRIDDRVPHSEWKPGQLKTTEDAEDAEKGPPFKSGLEITPPSVGFLQKKGILNGPPLPERREYPAEVEAEASDSADEIRREVEADIQKKRAKFVGKFDANTCGCGCGSPVYGGRVFFRGHKSRGIANPIPAAAVPEVNAKQEKSAMMKPCKCGCGQETNRRTGYLWGHKGLAAKASTAPKTVATLRVRTPAAPAVDPDAPERVQISVNAAYLDHFWQGRSIAEKARMVSNFFSLAGD